MCTSSMNYTKKDFKLKPSTSGGRRLRKVVGLRSLLNSDNVPDYINPNAQRRTLPDGGEYWHDIGYLHPKAVNGSHPGGDPVGPQGSLGDNIGE